MSTLSPDAQASKTPRAGIAHNIIQRFRAKNAPVPQIIILSQTLAEIEYKLQDMYQFRRNLTEEKSYMMRNLLDNDIRELEGHKHAVMADYIGVLNAGSN